jgi:hypothetical protein
VFDQLYWTADQLTWRQLLDVLLALGRLQRVAVPGELQERLLAYAALGVKDAVAAQQGLAQQLLAAAADETGSGDDSGSSSSSSERRALQQRVASQRYWVAKRVGQLLRALAALRQQLVHREALAAMCGRWLVLVVEAAAGEGAAPPGGAVGAVATPAKQAGSFTVPPAFLASSLHAAAQLGASLPPGAHDTVLRLLSAQRQVRLPLHLAALGLWGAVGVGCRPAQAWLQAWLGDTTEALRAASVGDMHMLLQVCCRTRCLPPRKWWAVAAARLQEQAPRMAAGNCVMTARLLRQLLEVERQQQQGQQGQQGPGRRAVALARTADLLSALARRVEVLETQERVPVSQAQAFDRQAQALRERLGPVPGSSSS